MIEWLLWLVGALALWAGSGELRAWRAKKRVASAETRALAAEDQLAAQWRMIEAQAGARHRGDEALDAARESLADGRRDQLSEP